MIEYTHDDVKVLEDRFPRTARRQPLGLSQDQVMFGFGTAEGYIKGKTKGQYPAPLAALRAMQKGINLPLEEGLKAERDAALEVMGSPISANLIGIFFMNNRLSRDPGVNRDDLKPEPVQRVGVVGAGLMGSGIATAHARSGIPTAMVDVDEKSIASGLKRAEDVIASRIKIGRATPQDMADMLARLNTSTGHTALAEADVVVEAIVEKEQAKHNACWANWRATSSRPNAILAARQRRPLISITSMA